MVLLLYSFRNLPLGKDTIKLDQNRLARDFQEYWIGFRRFEMEANLIYYQLFFCEISKWIWVTCLKILFKREFLTFRNDPILATIPDRLTERPDFSSQFWVAFLGRKFIWSDNCFLHKWKCISRFFKLKGTKRNVIRLFLNHMVSLRFRLTSFSSQMSYRSRIYSSPTINSEA